MIKQIRALAWRLGLIEGPAISWEKLPATAHDYGEDEIRAGAITDTQVYNYFAIRPTVKLPGWAWWGLAILAAALVLGLIIVVKSPGSFFSVLSTLFWLYLILGGIIALRYYTRARPLRDYLKRDTITDTTYDRLLYVIQDTARRNAIKRLYIQPDVAAVLFPPTSDDSAGADSLLTERGSSANQISAGAPIWILSPVDEYMRYQGYIMKPGRGNRSVAARYKSCSIRLGGDNVVRYRRVVAIWLIPLDDQLTYYRLPADTGKGVRDAVADEEFLTKRWFYQDVAGIQLSSRRAPSYADPDLEQAVRWSGPRLQLTFKLDIQGSEGVEQIYGIKTEYADPLLGTRTPTGDEARIDEYLSSLNSFIIQKKSEMRRGPVQSAGGALPGTYGQAAPQASYPASPQPAQAAPQPVWDAQSRQWILPPRWDEETKQWIVPSQPAASAASVPPAAAPATPSETLVELREEPAPVMADRHEDAGY